MFDLGDLSQPRRQLNPRQIDLGGVPFDVQTINSAAPGKDQDALLVAEGFAAVADGATPLNGNGSDVAQFARDALHSLSRNVRLPCRTMYRTAIESFSSGAQISLLEHPSCTVATARSCGDAVELSSLCDSFAVARLAGGAYVVVQDQGPPFDPVLKKMMGELTARGMTFEDARAEIVKVLRAERPRLMNKRGGYWVFANDPEAADHAVSETVAAEELDAVLLATDGFGRLFDLFNIVSGPEALLELATRDGLPEVIRLLRGLELDGDSMRVYPRPSIQDDATAILLTRTTVRRRFP